MKKIKFWQLFLFMGFVGLLFGGISLLCQSKSPDQDLRNLNPVIAFLIGYLPCQLGAVLFWLVSRKAGYKDGLPIK
jgi:hypothetical protein